MPSKSIAKKGRFVLKLLIIPVFLFATTAIAIETDISQQKTVENVLDEYMNCLLPKSAMGTHSKDTLAQVDEILPLCETEFNQIYTDNADLLAQNQVDKTLLKREGQKMLAGRIIKEKLILTKNPQDTIYHYRYCVAVWFEIGLPLLPEIGLTNLTKGTQTECSVGEQILKSQLVNHLSEEAASKYVVGIKQLAIDNVITALQRIEKIQAKKAKRNAS